VRIDAHQHFWQYSSVEYDWIDDSMAVLQRNFMPGDLAPLLTANGLDRCVAVQARQTNEETRWLLQLAEESPVIAGVVGWIDLCSSALGEELAACAGNPWLKGFRHVLQGEADDFMLQPDFVAGVKRLAEHSLAYDILVFERQLGSVRKLVGQLPDMPLVIDHIAKPDILNASFDDWADHMAALSRHSNVSCKVSGMVTEADWNRWTPETFERYLAHVFECFGEERVMFGSDWPVCTVAGDYATIVEIVADFVARNCSAADAAVFGDNARRIYNLD
jgi:L-fuconolactonase